MKRIIVAILLFLTACAPPGYFETQTAVVVTQRPEATSKPLELTVNCYFPTPPPY